jgi:hypothetical protein
LTVFAPAFLDLAGFLLRSRHDGRNNHNPHLSIGITVDSPQEYPDPPLTAKNLHVVLASSTSMKLILLSLLVIMFSSVARAFSTYAVKPALQPRLFSGLIGTARPMSSSAGMPPPDTSVVDTCLKKIQAALGSDNVKVTGTNNMSDE